MPDFSNAKVIRGKAFDGANGSKLAIEYNNIRYMLKFPNSSAEKKTELSYTNNCISEYIGSHIFESIGLNTHKTTLGTYRKKDSTKIVCACVDFTAHGEIFSNFASVKNTIIDSKHNGAGTELDSITEAIQKQDYIEPQTVENYFWDLFVVDSLIGNFDRHNGNWGFLTYPDGTIDFTPVFDCGSSVLPQADEKTMIKVLQNKDELDKRVYVFPTSAIKINGRKINYYDFMISCENENCNKAIKRIFSKIDMRKIENVIKNTPYITDLQREFYNTFLKTRYDKILVPTYNKIQSKAKTIAQNKPKFRTEQADKRQSINEQIKEAKNQIEYNRPIKDDREPNQTTKRVHSQR